MEQMKRCTNCGKFPFCEDDVSDEKDGVCANWIKRKMETKLDSKIEQEFDFSKVYNHIPRLY